MQNKQLHTQTHTYLFTAILRICRVQQANKQNNELIHCESLMEFSCCFHSVNYQQTHQGFHDFFVIQNNALNVLNKQYFSVQIFIFMNIHVSFTGFSLFGNSNFICFLMCLHMLIYPYTLSNIDYSYSWIFGANICIIVIFCVLLF